MAHGPRRCVICDGPYVTDRQCTNAPLCPRPRYRRRDGLEGLEYWRNEWRQIVAGFLAPPVVLPLEAPLAPPTALQRWHRARALLRAFIVFVRLLRQVRRAAWLRAPVVPSDRPSIFMRTGSEWMTNRG